MPASAATGASAAALLRAHLGKSGVGSRGGRVIGYTRSSAPIYASAHATDSAYASFGKQQHSEAAAMHAERAENHLASANYHKRQVEQAEAGGRAAHAAEHLAKMKEHHLAGSTHGTIGAGHKLFAQ